MSVRYTLLFASLFFVLSYIFPVFYQYSPSFFHELLAFLVVVFIFLALSVLRPFWFCGRLTICVLFVSVIPLLHLTLGVSYFVGDAILVSLYFFASACAVACGNNILLNGLREKALLMFAVLFVLIGLINVFFAINQYFNVALIDGFLLNTSGRPFGNIGQSNNFSGVLIISFLCGWYLFEKAVVSRKLYYVWVFYISIGLVLAQSRTTVMVCLCLIVFYRLFYRKIIFRSTFYDLVWVTFCYANLYVLLPLVKQVLGGGGGSLRELVIYDSGRLSIWYESIQAIINGPLLGYGWNQIGVAQVLVESNLSSAIHFRHAHNVLLDLLLYNGPVLGTILITALIVFAWRAFTYCRTLEGWVVLAIIGAVLTHAMVEFPLHYAYFILPVAFLMGLVDSPAVENGTSVFRFSYPSWLNFPVMVVGGVLLAIIWREATIINKEHFKLGIELTGVFKRQLASEKTNDIVLLTHRREYLNFGRATPVEGMSGEDIEWMKKVSHRFPSPYYLSKYAKACQLNGQYDEAGRMLKVIKRLFDEEMYVSSKRFIYEGVDEGD